jgi:hypothetical protein
VVVKCEYAPEHDNACVGYDDFEISNVGVLANTKLQYATYDANGRIINRKGGNIKKLYERFHDSGMDMRTNRFNIGDLSYSIPFVNNGGYVAHQKIINVLRCSSTPCCELTTESGLAITVACDQRLSCGNNSYKKASNFCVGDEIMIHNGTCFSKEHSDRKKYLEVLVKYHPNGIKKIVDKKYEYYRIQVSHAVYEAHRNGMLYDDYIYALNHWSREQINALWVVNKDLYDIHHKDVDSENNTIENLELLTKTEHGQLHASERKKNLSFVPVIDTVKSVQIVESQETYILVCENSNNFIANKFVIQTQIL